jgi:Flp pilus assembly protein TadG
MPATTPEVAAHLPRSPVRRKKRAGGAAVELAILAPILAGVVIGMFQMSRIVMIKEVLCDAARKGCRTGIYPNRANADITADVNNILTDNNLTSSNATITILVNGNAVDASTAKQNDQISVKVSFPLTKVGWLPLFFDSGITVSSETVVMMRQG